MKLSVAVAAWILLGGLGVGLRPDMYSQLPKTGETFGKSSSASQSSKSSQPFPTAPDYSNQTAVVESMVTNITYHDDGTSSTISSARVRVQSQAGLQAFGMLRFPYASATTTLKMAYVRVIKPDKRVVETPEENVLDMPADITRQAPFYSDLKELQVAVKGLEIGDTLEVESRADVTKPLDPGQFWISYNFSRDAVVLHEELHIQVPLARKVTVKSATVQPVTTQEGAYRVYSWQTQNLTVKAAKQEASEETDSKQPDVQVTSFQSWDEVGQWFRSLAAPRAEPTPEVKAKADDLTRGTTTEEEKIRDLYAYVSTNFRYIGIALGIGRYQPHAAAEVLSNDYGDCKDKHTLFAALLAAEGVKAYPALISSGKMVDVDVPSPAQFDHVITAIPQANSYLFLDTTPEVGPFGYLMANLRGKKALVIPDSGPAQLVETPADPPFRLFFDFQADGTLDEVGTLTSKMQITFRDDAELLYRMALRRACQPQWKDVMQSISGNLGFGGTVSDVTVSPPDQTQTPLHIEYSYQRKEYSDWDDKWIGAPFPPIFLPGVPDDTGKKVEPIKLGAAEETVYTASLKLPAGMSANLPNALHMNEPFADYDSTYTISGGVVHVERKLMTKVREIAPPQIEAYRKFEKAIEKDEKINIYLAGNTSDAETSGSPEAQKLFEQGREAWQLHDLPGAIDYFRQAVNKDAKYAQAWTSLGLLQASTGSRDEAVDDLKKAIALDPQQTQPYETLSTLFMMQRQPEESLELWKGLEKASPTNAVAPLRIGAILLSMKRYSEAVPELEDAVKRNLGNATLLTQLGIAYAHSGAKDKAIASFEDALKSDSSANNLNTIAYEMADANLKLDEALQYAQKAVADEESATAKIDIEHLEPEDLGTAAQLAAFWDTLGWAYFRTGDLEKAERYLNAGWHLSQDPVIADHLGQLYEKEGKKLDAVKSYESAEATGRAPDNSRRRLNVLGEDGESLPAERLQDMRIVHVSISPKPKKHADAEFSVMLGPGPKVVATKFIRGDEVLRDGGKAIAAAKFDAPFPDDGPVQVLRRGILDCEPELGECSFAMYPLNSPYPAQLIAPLLRPTPNAGSSNSPTLKRRGS